MSANIELVTSHQGTPHITTDQVKDLLAGFSGDITGVKIFSQLDDGLEATITDLLEVEIATGQGLAGGYHFQNLSAYTWLLDTENVGYSRIDVLYLVIYEDALTTVQSADFVYQKGTAYANGTTGNEPSAPTGTNVKETFKLYRADITDGAIVTVTGFGTAYLSNKSLADTVTETVAELEQNVGGTVAQVNANTQALNGLRFGKDNNGNYGYYKVGADSVTPFRNPKGNAVAEEVLAGKTFANANSDELSGTMTNRGAWTGSTSGSGNLTIPKGYHNGNGYVSGASSYNSGHSDGQAVGRSETSNHTLTFSISGMGSPYSMDLFDGSRKVSTVSLSGSNYGSISLYGTLAAKTSYNGGLTT